ncbi:PGAMP domain-containing protein [Rhizoctonia solani]|uniref:PGAMP domain-containing protein n=1 Tax=Rhizoctonia solani TaxID=456999 RepID=A0A8H8T093_9AGAM|nr:PGAMP domain-containing protein [Rhizoctonia solani]QRW23427.1 PGAMP domain-containing protein [Rhizoctonia solani]
MSNPKSEKYNAEPSRLEDQTIRKSSHSHLSRSDIFSRLVKLVGLSERSTKTPTHRYEVGRTGGLAVIGEQQAQSTVNLAVDRPRLMEGPDLSLIYGPAQLFNLDTGKNKCDKKSIRRKAKNLPVVEPIAHLIPIPESTSTSQRTSLIPDLSCVKINNFADQDALMETDSIRARAAIAMARAQLEHSRPASYNRKLERSSNHMMMLPNELDEYFAVQSSKEREKLSAQLAAHTKNEVHDRICEDDLGAMRKAVGQSQAMVLTLMAAKEAISQRATARKNHHSPLASSSATGDLPKPGRPGKPFQGLYRAGDIHLLPLHPFLFPNFHPLLMIVPPTTAYKELPNEYDNDDEIMKHIDVLMQSLTDSSNNAWRRSNENSLIDSGRRDYQRKPIENLSHSTSYSGLRHLSNETNRSQPNRLHLTPSAVPPVPTIPRPPTKASPPLPGAAGPAVQPFHGVKVENLSVTQMNDNGMFNQCNFILSSYNDFGELTHTTRVSYPRSVSHEPSLPNIPSGHTEKYFQQFARLPHLAARYCRSMVPNVASYLRQARSLPFDPHSKMSVGQSTELPSQCTFPRVTRAGANARTVFAANHPSQLKVNLDQLYHDPDLLAYFFMFWTCYIVCEVPFLEHLCRSLSLRSSVCL